MTDKATHRPRRPARYALYPYLLACCFPLWMWLHNAAEDPTLSDLAVVFGITGFYTVATDVLLRRLMRHAAARSVVHTLLVMGCFAYGHAAQLLAVHGMMDRHVAPIWCLLLGTLIAAACAGRKRHVVTLSADYLRAVGVALLGIQLLGAGGPISKTWTDRASAASDVVEREIPAEDIARPDIYYLILDGYAREDVLRELFDFDNHEFIAALRDRGFYVADEARSNYSQTRLSLPSSMNMDYLPDFPTADGYGEHHQQLRVLRKQGAAVRRLRELGYWYRYVGSCHYPRNDAADEQLFHGGTNGEFVLSFVATTALDLLRDAVRLSEWFHDDVDFHEFQFSRIPRTRRGDPTFTFAHICCPHPPYVYDRNGPLPAPIHKEVAQPRDYLEQIRYLNKKILAMVDQIESTSDGQAVILLQADHGSDLLGMPDRPSAEQLQERMSIFSAYRCPPRVVKHLYPTITPVNSFRVLLSALFADPLPTLPDRSYYSSYDAPFQFVEY